MADGSEGAAGAAASPAPETGWSALWALVLKRAEHRRAGRPPIATNARDATSARDARVARDASDAGDASDEIASVAADLEARHPAAARLLALYEPLLQHRAPPGAWVIAHLGQSLDGFIATRSGDSRYVTGAQDLDHMHRLRALSDAVIVGAGTVAIDDPQLTTRRVPGPNPVRVVLDPLLRAPPSARVLQDGAAPTLWLCDARRHDPALAGRVAARMLPVPGLAAADGLVDARVARRALAAQGLRVLFVEGGGVTVSRFLAQCQVDRLHLTLAPVLIGEGRRGVRLPASGTMADCLRPAGRIVMLGDDVLWDFALSGAAGGQGEEVDMADAQACRGDGGGA